MSASGYDENQYRLSAYGTSTRPWLDIDLPHFHICRGARPTIGKTIIEGGDRNSGFYQFEAWPVRAMVLDHVQRIIESEVREDL